MSAPLANGAKAATDANVDLSHHLSTVSKSRQPSPLKDIVKYMYEPGMTSLAGGLPHPSLFPFQSADFQIFAPDSLLTPAEEGGQHNPTLQSLHLSRDAPKPQNCLSKGLQYTGGGGDPELNQICYDFTKNVYKPARSDFEILLHTGNTDGWGKVVQLLCEPGEYILVEQFVYPSAQHFYIPFGCKGAPVRMDGDGLDPDGLEEVLSTWEQTHPGVKRPHVLYQVPVGHNPCGTTLSWERKQRIYDIAVKWDLIIVEDDPYYWLQLPPYQTPDAPRQTNGHAPKASLVPSFLQLDTQGRVIRLETFSKTIAPGLRLGYFVGTPLFIERLLRATEVQSQAPSGWSQAIVLELLKRWGQDGYLQWLSNVKDAYTVRRDWMCDALGQNLSLKANDAGDFVASIEASGAKSVEVLTFTPPKAGMFIWTSIHLSTNPDYQALRQKMDGPSAIAEWSNRFWHDLIKNKLLLTPGSYYEPWQGPNVKSTAPEDVAFFRLAYSFEAKDDIFAGVAKFADALTKAWS